MKELFYKPLKINDKEENILWWSDMHIGQLCERWSEPLWKKRGFSCLQEHDNQLVQRWNNKCSSNSIVFNLGDIIFNRGAEVRLRELLDSLQFKDLFLFFGNHVAGTKQIIESLPPDENVWQMEENKRVIFCPNYLEAFCNGIPIVMSHYAIASFNGQGKGAFCVHGHSHGSLYDSELGKLLYKARIIDVGVENCPEPINLKELKEKFKDCEVVNFDHHNQETSAPFC